MPPIFSNESSLEDQDTTTDLQSPFGTLEYPFFVSGCFALGVLPAGLEAFPDSGFKSSSVLGPSKRRTLSSTSFFTAFPSAQTILGRPRICPRMRPMLKRYLKQKKKPMIY